MRVILIALIVSGMAVSQADSRSETRAANVRDVRLANGAHVVVERVPGAPGCAICLAFPMGVEHEDMLTAGGLIKMMVVARAGAHPARTFKDLRKPGRLFLTEVGYDFSLIAMAFDPRDLDRELDEVCARLRGIEIDDAGAVEIGTEIRTGVAPAASREAALDAQIVGRALQKYFLPLTHAYGPANATLSIVGDLDPEMITKKVRALIAPLPRGEAIPPERPVPFMDECEDFHGVGEVHSFYRLRPPLDWDWYFESGWSTPSRRGIAVGCPLPPAAGPDFAAAFVFAGPYLSATLPRWPEDRSADARWVRQNCNHDFRSLKVSATLNHWEGGEHLISNGHDVRAELTEVLRRPIDPAVWESIKDDARKRIGMARKGTPLEQQDVFARAITRARHAQLGVDTPAFEKSLEALSLAEMRRVAEAILAQAGTWFGFG